MKIPSKALQFHVTQYLQATRNPRKIQEKLLRKILQKNKKTVFGKKHQFSSIRNVKEFQERIPICSYEDLKPYIKRMQRGEPNILCNATVTYFATTSATTSETKLLPVTKIRKKQLQQELLLWMFFVLKNYKNVLKGKLLYFAGPPFEGSTIGGIPKGSISGYMATQRPWYTSSKVVIPPHVYNEPDITKKTQIIANLALREKNITQIGFFAPIEAILFFDYLQENKETLINNVLAIKPKRGRELQQLKVFNPASIWPNLQLINCIKSDAQLPYLQKLEELIGKKIDIRDPGIYASEGRLSLGITAHKRAGIIVATENFFEFIPQKKKNKAKTLKKPLLLDELKKGEEYKVIITTQEGLYRYEIGDIVKVVDFKNKLPVVQFVSREHFINIVGELAPEQQLITSAKKIIAQNKNLQDMFTYIPKTSNQGKKPHYELIIESTCKVPQNKLCKIQKEMDAKLQNNITDYKQMRNEFGRMGMLQISLAQQGSFAQLARQQLGGSGQPKHKFITHDNTIKNKVTIIQSTYEEAL